MKQAQRHGAIIELLRLQGYVSTEELVEHFDGIPQTIRRDLNGLANQNMIQRHHGGAALPSSSVNAAYNDSKVMWSVEKARIAQQRVACQIPEVLRCLSISGTTPEAVAHALINHKNLRVVTNNLERRHPADRQGRLLSNPGWREIRARDGGIMGEATLDFISQSQFRLDYGILGISGIDMGSSLLEFDYHEVRTKRAIIENSRCVMLVTDHSKFGRNAIVNLGNMNLIDYLFTDQRPSLSMMKIIEQYDVQLELC